jgi:1L-myo-inositol 1-phosphate cytidylyltransferase
VSAPQISEAVILMAGSGSRLRAGERSLPKPLVPILGRPLISYTLGALARAGIRTVYAVIGFEKDFVRREVARLAPPGLEVRFLENPDWQKQNGVSVLAAAAHVHTPFLLTMSDHLFEQVIVDRLLGYARADALNLAVDRKIAAIFDLDDAMKVQTSGDRIVAIGKNLENYNAIDTGLFVCPSSLFDYLENAKRENDCSLADGVRAMAEQNQARVVDIGDAWWQDVDTPEMFRRAEGYLRQRVSGAGLHASDAREHQADGRGDDGVMENPSRLSREREQ